jgi:hypothetical protein
MRDNRQIVQIYCDDLSSRPRKFGDGRRHGSSQGVELAMKVVMPVVSRSRDVTVCRPIVAVSQRQTSGDAATAARGRPT